MYIANLLLLLLLLCSQQIDTDMCTENNDFSCSSNCITVRYLVHCIVGFNCATNKHKSKSVAQILLLQVGAKIKSTW